MPGRNWGPQISQHPGSHQTLMRLLDNAPPLEGILTVRCAVNGGEEGWRLALLIFGLQGLPQAAEHSRARFCHLGDQSQARLRFIIVHQLPVAVPLSAVVCVRDSVLLIRESRISWMI